MCENSFSTFLAFCAKGCILLISVQIMTKLMKRRYFRRFSLILQQCLVPIHILHNTDKMKESYVFRGFLHFTLLSVQLSILRKFLRCVKKRVFQAFFAFFSNNCNPSRYFQIITKCVKIKKFRCFLHFSIVPTTHTYIAR